MKRAKWRQYRDLSLIGLFSLILFCLAVKIFYPSTLEGLEFYTIHQKTDPKVAFLNERIKDISPSTYPSFNEDGPSSLAKSDNRLNQAPVKTAAAGKLPILMYHYIEIPPAKTALPGLYLDPEIFAKQLEFIQKQGYKTMFVSELARQIKDGKTDFKKEISLTFDDGYKDFYTQAFPLLKKYQTKATLYVIINRLDQPDYISRAELKELARSGLVEIGSHTFNHPDLKTLDERRTSFEIETSRHYLSQLTGQPTLTFAYPFGRYDQADLKLAAQAGYEAAVSTDPGSWQGKYNLMALKRLRPGNRQGEAFKNWLEDWE